MLVDISFINCFKRDIAFSFLLTCSGITDLSIEDGALTVRTTPVASITALANPHYGARIQAGHHQLNYHARPLRTADGQALEGIIDGDLLTGATFRSAPGVRYVRIMITDEQGRRGWSNPVWVGNQ